MESLKKYTLRAGILILLCVGSIQDVISQISVGGEAYYELDVVGYMGRGDNGCGDVDGLKQIIAINNSNHILYDGRMIYEPFHVNDIHDKNDPVTDVEIRKTIRYRTGATCDGGPSPRTNYIEEIDFCFSEYMENAHDGLRQLTVTNRPVVTLNEIASEAILGNRDVLRVELPDNLHNSHYNWMFQVGSGPERPIPSSFNGSNILELLGEDFLFPSDFGETISVWLEMDCDAGERLAEGIARRNTYVERREHCYSLDFVGLINCISELDNYVNENYTDHLTPDLIAEYQSRVSNVIQFQYLRTAPHIIEADPTAVSCYDSQDGQIRLSFNRPLETNESLDISVVDMSRPEGGTDTNGRPRYEVVETYNSISDFDSSNGILLEGLPPSTSAGFRIDLVGGGGSVPLYTGGINHTAVVNINRPSAPVSFQITDVINVWCNDDDNDPANNNDGEIHLRASGGNPGTYQFSITGENQTGTWQDFSESTTHDITGLRPGNYNIRVRKWIPARGVYCYAKEQTVLGGEILLGEEIVMNREITQPEAPLQLVYEHHIEPAASGFTNGSITARVFGGTPTSGNTYNFQWRNSNGTLMTNTTTRYEAGQGYFITLNNIPAGTYFLTVTDNNYSRATFKTGCAVVSSEFELEQPDPLQVIFEVTNPISCNSENTSNDPFSDGELTVHASGGIQLNPLVNNGLPYYYTWRSRNETGTWQVIPEERDSIFSDVGDGEYAVNITDANGIVLGEYSNNILIRETDSITTLSQPELLQISYTKEDVFCYGGHDGSIDLTIEGGTTPYSIVWNNGETTEDINSLSPEVYAVAVTDARGCRAYETIEIMEPDELLVSYPTLFEQPTGFGLTNGWTEATVQGGTALDDGTYNFQWRNENGDLLNGQVSQSVDNGTEIFTIRLNNIGRGTYILTVTDANYAPAADKAGCARTELSFTLNEPDPLNVTIEEYNSISCNQNNQYGNPSSDGVLIAHATGGVHFNPGLPYIYTWKKQNPETGEWEVLATQTDSIANALDAGQYAVNIEDRNGIVLGEYENNMLARETDSIYKLTEPELLTVSLDKRDVFCKYGTDGWAEVHISGGTPPYEILWNNGDITARTIDLMAETYEVIVTDSRGCEVIDEIEIFEPLDPVEITYHTYGRPSSIGASDAWIEARVSGGTTFGDGSYEYEWVNASGESLNLQTNASVITDNGISYYQIRLNDISAGTYYITLTDQNYEIADTKEGCTIIESDFIIHEPIEAVIEVHTPISCNSGNEFLDPYSDGQLIAHIEGGVPFPSGQAYNYYWKKQDENGTWQILNGQGTHIASGLNDGNYALNVEDALGNVMGVYQGDLLVEASDSTFYFTEPELVVLDVNSTPISCSAGNDGTATVSISGGTPGYHIEWSNGKTTPTIENLIAGTYFVYVTDSRGCKTTGQVTIGQPGGINIDIEKTNPTCFERGDGVIEVNVTGGTPPYSYSWNTGSTSTIITGLTAGRYSLQLIDSEGCTAFVDVPLENPIPVPIDLGENRTICMDQSLILNIGIDDPGATYRWESDNGFTSNAPDVELTEPGLYSATITTSLGCVGYQEIEVKASSEPIDAHFVLSTQAFAEEEVLLVNISSPVGDKVEWTLPEGVDMIYEANNKIIVLFEEAGSYDINLRSYQGDCYQDYTKNIIVEKATELQDIGDSNNPFIEEFIVYPNPSNGYFKIKLYLAEEANISVKVISLITSNVMDTRVEGGARDFLLEYDLQHMQSGVYLLLLETPKGDEIRKLVFD